MVEFGRPGRAKTPSDRLDRCSISTAISAVETDWATFFEALRMPERRSIRARCLVEKDVAAQHLR